VVGVAASRSLPQIGSLVRARGRDWVVLPSEEEGVVRLRPLTGAEDDTIGIFLPVEPDALTASEFPLPDPAHAGDTTGGLLLRDAARLSLRSGAAPFRSLGRVAVTPRPYQFVPLIMALRLDPVRLLVADDVGVGKTVEAAMIARELLDRGLARRLAVICPAHLCDQWEQELREKFALDAALIQPSRIARLERDLPRADVSIYQYYRHLVASIDFLKSDRNRGPFLQYAPDLVIVDEAHIATRPPRSGERAQQQRYEFLRTLAAEPRRHVILVTATPHSGIEESFRSLLGLLDPAFDVYGEAEPPELDRKLLLPHFVQRRRGHLVRWLGTTTPFPERESEERQYGLTAAYHALFDDVLAYCRETIQGGAGLRAQQQRVRHWAAIALLRCVLSSPDAAVAVLSERARKQEERSAEVLPEASTDLDAVYRPQVLDPLDDEQAGDYVPSAPLEDAEASLTSAERRRLAGFLQRARELAGPDHDRKLAETARAVGELLRQGYRAIVFCRFIATAKYLEAWLPKLLGRDFAEVQVKAVTGEIGDEERRARVDELTAAPVRVLVATDCLSEGINLQQHFDAVLHYDLPWNPNRLEQREGRVDRFGQDRDVVKTVLLYGADNPVDLVVLDVLIRKARAINRQLGVAVPVPVQSEQVVQAVVESVLLRRGARGGVQLELAFDAPEVSRLHGEWNVAAEREARDRAYFSQHGIQPDEVAQEIDAADPVLGDAAAVEHFVANAAQRLGGTLRPTGRTGVYELHPGALRGTLEGRGYRFPLAVTFTGPGDERTEYLGRTHPVVAGYCDRVLGAALGPEPDERFARCGASFTRAVTLRTGVVLLRLRYLLHERVEEFAEEVVLAAFQRREGRLVWLDPFDSAARELMDQAEPAANMPAGERAEHVAWALQFLQDQPDWAAPILAWRQAQLQASHNRLRKLVRAATLDVRPHTPPDILGCWVLVPVGGSR
jgi:superfamily II DNA or RNA helicase